MQIHKLRLNTSELPALQLFYTQVLGFELLEGNAEQFTVQCGHTQLTFEQGKAAYYHFAFNIFPDQLHAAADWLEAKGISLHPLEGARIVSFPNWEAEAVYFEDPAGNILELIARRRLPMRGQAAFAATEIIGISEIGWATLDFDGLKHTLQTQLQVPVFGNPSAIFAALGDDHGLFILVNAMRKSWIPNNVPALPFPFRAEITEGLQTWHIHSTKSELLIDRL
jgi:catechol-2,3-dioxygenase